MSELQKSLRGSWNFKPLKLSGTGLSWPRSEIDGQTRTERFSRQNRFRAIDPLWNYFISNSIIGEHPRTAHHPNYHRYFVERAQQPQQWDQPSKPSHHPGALSVKPPRITELDAQHVPWRRGTRVRPKSMEWITGYCQVTDRWFGRVPFPTGRWCFIAYGAVHFWLV